MKSDKWFYKIQKNLDDKLHLDYDNVTTQFQEITKDRVFELKICTKSNVTEDNYKIDVLLCCMTKATDRFSIFQCIEK
jgi:hypothetical protein